jgi:hypothetical protein
MNEETRKVGLQPVMSDFVFRRRNAVPQQSGSAGMKHRVVQAIGASVKVAVV